MQAGQGIGRVDGSGELLADPDAGALTTAALDADKATRATGDAGRPTPRGSRWCAASTIRSRRPAACTPSGDAQVLTAAKLSGDGNKVLATGPLGRFATSRPRSTRRDGSRWCSTRGKYSPGGTGFDIPGYVSYIGPTQPRTYLDGPYKAYQRITGVVGPGR